MTEKTLDQTSTSVGQQVEDIMSDVRYISKSCTLITEALQNGCDVLQLPSGEIFITELKPITFQYTWDSQKAKLIRSALGPKVKKTKFLKPRAAGSGRKPSIKKEVEELV
jgi:hypothetical protein